LEDEKVSMRRNIVPGLSSFVMILSVLLHIPQYGHSLNLHTVTDGGPPIVTDEGVLFRYKNERENPRYVMVSGDFNQWEKPILMVKNSHNVFVYFYNKTDKRSIVLVEGTYRYRYLVDGVWMKDKTNRKSVHDIYGTELSSFEVPKPITIISHNPVQVNENSYIFYYRDDNAKNVFIVGDFNNWNPYSHPLRKNRGGIWEIEIDLVPGAYAYRFIVDGLFRRDPIGTKIVHDRFENTYSAFDLPLR
jgi:1,4-alpha-glucan branching enzyme